MGGRGMYTSKGASPELYRSLTLKFKETDNSFPLPCARGGQRSARARAGLGLFYNIIFRSFRFIVWQSQR